MTPEHALYAAAPNAPRDAAAGLTAARSGLEVLGALDTTLRTAHMIGQCAHESMRFTRRAEALSYRSADRIRAVFGARRVPDMATAEACVRNPERLANTVYAGILGNGGAGSGDGWRYRGRGWLQLTGRANYRAIGHKIGIDLEAAPERAEEPDVAWLVAAAFLANARSGGRTAFDWADRNSVERVTRIVNGRAMLGLAERRHMTALALQALGGLLRPVLREGDEGEAVRLLQHALTARGFGLGALDGDFGPKTRAALLAFQRHAGLAADGIAGPAVWGALDARCTARRAA